jgi:hypothetical protein
VSNIERNWPLLIKVVLHIMRHPETWYQGTYVNRCGTVFCVAGHAIILAGHQFVDYDHFADQMVLAGDIPDLADESWEDDEHGRLMHPGDAGRVLLGLDREAEDRLFNGNNTFPEILAFLNELAAEDGIDLPEGLALTPEVMDEIAEGDLDTLRALQKQMFHSVTDAAVAS